MKRVLIVGAGKGGSSLLSLLHQAENMKIIGVIDKNSEAEGLTLANQLGVPVGNNWKEWLSKENRIDIVIEATGDENVLQEMVAFSDTQTLVIPGSVAYIMMELFMEKEALYTKLQFQVKHKELILNNTRDGMIVVNEDATIQFLNKSAKRILDLKKESYIGKHIRQIIQHSRMPQVLRSKRKEVNQSLDLENGKRIITTRIPIINEENELLGAFAVFKDMTEILNLAEENTDLKEIKTMLEAIIQSSDEAISVVDENGIGLMINPAYTRITGLKKEEIIGKPAYVDISEGESMHMKVIKTRRPVRGVRMKVGPAKKDVLVNVAPVIVDGKLKGSVGVIHDVSEIQTLTSELKRARQIIRNLEAKYTFDDIIATSSEMKISLEQAKVGAKTPAIVLLRGASGTGKELFAHAIHNESDRKYHKFIRVNCAALSESVLESELFGYEEGAFTGAKRGGKKGLFEEANLGSIFLDEIGELSLNMQAKLLRVLQENEIVRVGGTNPIMVDVRIIAATNSNLEKAIMNKTFREDLYYRLNRLPIFIPSLQERLSDLPELTKHIIQKLNQDYGRNIKALSNEALDELQHYNWPGNVRELENVIGRAMIYMDVNEEVIEKHHLPNLYTDNKNGKPIHTSAISGGTLQEAVDIFEKDYIYKVYEANDFNKSKTAKALEISLRSLYYKLEKHKLE